MKKVFLKYKVKKALAQKQLRSNVAFEKARKIGVLFDSEAAFREGASFLKRINNGSRDIQTLVRIKKNGKQLPDFPHFSEREINFFGGIKSEALHKFVKQPFDYLFYFGKAEGLIIHYILGASKAKCRVGFHTQGKERMYDLMFSYNKQRPLGENMVYVLEQLEAIRVG